MSSRKLGYVIVCCLMSFVVSAPQLLLVYVAGMDLFCRANLFPGIAATPIMNLNSLLFEPFWQDQFISVTTESWPWNETREWKVMGTNPETGEKADLKLRMNDPSWADAVGYDQRLWLIGGRSEFEIVDGNKVSSTVKIAGCIPTFDWNGEPAFIIKSVGNDFGMNVCRAGVWTAVATVVIPESDRKRSLGGMEIDFTKLTGMDCIQCGGRLHLFANVDGHVLYREGIELTMKPPAPYGQGNSGISNGAPSDEPVSALRAANSDDDLDCWSVVCSNAALHTQPQAGDVDRNAYGMTFEGAPAALLVDGVLGKQPVGRILRFDGIKWTVFASQQFPFGTRYFRVVATRDGRRSYIVAATMLGRAFTYGVDSTGIRQTNGARNARNPRPPQIIIHAGIALIMLGLGLLLGLAMWFVMWLCTKPDYGFGKQNIKLASLGGRGLARLIDLGGIVGSTIGLGWVMSKGCDWRILLEALNLRVDHPTIHEAGRIAGVLAVWVAAVVFILILSQAAWGVTPGKWLCRLRCVRTSLRPCGFLSSLTRELLLVIESGYYLCWTPGILCIAITDQRQRVGDLVADTIVVDVRTLARRFA